MIFKCIVISCLLVLLYLVFKLRSQVRRLEKYYKDIKIDNSIIKAKMIQASRQLEVNNITKQRWLEIQNYSDTVQN